jgi:hypothetical protein
MVLMMITKVAVFPILVPSTGIITMNLQNSTKAHPHPASKNNQLIRMRRTQIPK